MHFEHSQMKVDIRWLLFMLAICCLNMLGKIEVSHNQSGGKLQPATVVYTKQALLDIRSTMKCNYVTGSTEAPRPYLHVDTVHYIQTLGLAKRGVRGGKHVKQRTRISQTGINYNNLITLKLTDCGIPTNIKPGLVLATVNTRSLRNKVSNFVEFAVDNKLDICIVTETWFQDTDVHLVSQIQDSGYKFLSVPRKDRTGGGLGLLYRTAFSVKSCDSGEHTSFEFAEWTVKHGSFAFNIHAIYRPPYSANHPVTVSTFEDEFRTYLQATLLTKKEAFFLGDFNIHCNKPDDTAATSFVSILNDFNLQQLVECPTHESGNTLDCIVVKKDTRYSFTPPTAECYISDHSFVTTGLNIKKPLRSSVTVEYRDLKNIDVSVLRHKLQEFNIHGLSCQDLHESARYYSQELVALLDSVAPLKKKVVCQREKYPWYSDSLKELKKERRGAERQWLRSGLCEDHLIFKQKRDTYNKLLKKSKDVCIREKVTQCCGDSKAMYNLVSNMLCKKADNPMPDCDGSTPLADTFADFFLEKIEKIRTELDGYPLYVPEHRDVPAFEQFSYVSEEKVISMLKSMKYTTCPSDPFPSKLLMQHVDVFAPFLTKMVNQSLGELFPMEWKTAFVFPLIKKPGLERILKNYRPVSNICLVSKLVEKCSLQQFTEHMNKYSLLPAYQSAYRQYHSTETALIKLVNDVLFAMDRKMGTLAVAVDLSAAFDTVNHDVMLSVLQHSFGVSEKPLQWFESYLRPRDMIVRCDGQDSEPRPLHFSVPQGSCMGPVLFTCYSSTLATAVQGGQEILGYADDHSFYDTFNIRDCTEEQRCVQNMQDTLKSVKQWMSYNRLKMNDAKTEAIVFRSIYYNDKLSTDRIEVGDNDILYADCIKLLGVWLDCNMSMKVHVEKKCRTASYYLSLIRNIRGYLDRKTCEMLVHSLVMSHVDYASVVLYGLPDVVISRLQSIQNMAAKLILLREREDSTTQCLKDLHWLPIRRRITFRTVCFVHKCLHGRAPSYLCELISVRTSNYRLRRLEEEKGPVLNIVPSNTNTFGPRAFSSAAYTEWNILPSYICIVENLLSFKRKLKTYYFNLSFK